MFDKNKETLSPLPSVYRNVKFRSRLKARWAAYFDLIGLPWQYEPEGYALPSGNYCPDFLCNDFFVAIKPDQSEMLKVENKLSELARLSGKFVFCCVGPPSLESQSAWDEDGHTCCSAVFCHYAFTRKGWDVPFFSEDGLDFMDEEYHRIAANMRFERGIAVDDFS